MSKKIVILLLVCFTLNGCVSLQKKFVRKKKSKEEVQMYLDLKDYPETPAGDVYRTHYLYVRGWLDEISMLIKSDGNPKRLKMSMNKVLESLEILNKAIKDEYAQKVTEKIMEIEASIPRVSVLDSYRKSKLAEKVYDLKKEFSKVYKPE